MAVAKETKGKRARAEDIEDSEIMADLIREKGKKSGAGDKKNLDALIPMSEAGLPPNTTTALN
jgi:hypothetical protein